MIAAMEANHPHLTTQKSFYVEISRARDRAELVTDDAARLREQLETATGERISALEGIGEAARDAPAKGMEAAANAGRIADREAGPVRESDRGRSEAAGKETEPVVRNREPAAPGPWETGRDGLGPLRARSALAEARINPKDYKLVEAFGAIHLKAGGESPEPSTRTGQLHAPGISRPQRRCAPDEFRLRGSLRRSG